MEKDFDTWSEVKKTVHNKPERVFFHPREIWFAHIGVNVGFEQDGRGNESLRPILVLRKFNNEVFWAIPLTRQEKPRNPYYARFSYAPFPEITGAALEDSVCILSQLRLVDAKRLKYKIGTVHEEEFEALKQKIRRLLA